MIFINIRCADFKNQHHFQILRASFEISGITDFLLFIVVCATNDLHVTFQWPWGHIDFQLIFAQLSEEHFSISYLLVRHNLMVKQWSNVYNRVLFYLAQKLCFWTGIIFTRVYVSVCLCVCVSVNVYIDYLKKFFTDFDEIWQDDVE